jgi:hypothetical protein
LGCGWCVRVWVLSSWELLDLPPRNARSKSRCFSYWFCSGSSPTEWNRLFPHDCRGRLRFEPLCLSPVRTPRGIFFCCFGGERGLGGDSFRLRGTGVRDFGCLRRCMGLAIILWQN